MPGDDALIAVYRRFPVTLVRGRGVHVYDDAGTHYWDFLAGIGVNALGHDHPDVRRALEESVSLLHVSNLYWNRPQIELARRLSELTGGMRVFFANSGTEANEAGIKLMRRWGGERERSFVLSFQGGFHGRTLGSLAATPESRYQDPFRPLPDGFGAVPYGDLEALSHALTAHRPAGVMVEVIQGESGVVMPPEGFVARMAEMVREAGALLLVDEVQTGMGRTGHWFAFDHDKIRPDLVTLAKGLGAGIPVGAVLAAPDVADAFRPGDHGSTFGGNPLATRVGLAVVNWLAQGGLEHVGQMGAKMQAGLSRIAARHPERVAGVRGRGLMWGLLLHEQSAPLAEAAFANGLLINATGGRVLRFLPPLVVDGEAIDAMLEILDRILGETHQQ